jgi:hypothetical protein
LEAKDEYGTTGFQYACETNHVGIINLFFQYGVDVDEIMKTLTQVGAVVPMDDPEFQHTFQRQVHSMIIGPQLARIPDLNMIVFLFGQFGVVADLFLPEDRMKIYTYERIIRRYRKLFKLCKIEIVKCQNFKNTIKKIWFDVELEIIDIICNFCHDTKNLKHCIRIIEDFTS